MDIKGCVAVVTGAGSGIGKALALALAEEGADVVVADLNDEWMNDVCREIETLGRKALAIHTDVSKVEQIQNLYEQSIKEMGRVDILVNNAGIHMIGPLNKTTLANWKEIVDINLWSVIYGVHTFLPHFEERGSGYIVNTASIAGQCGALDPSVPYTTTKFGVVGLSEGLSLHLHGSGVGVAVICPGLVQTRIMDAERVVDPQDESTKNMKEVFEGKTWKEIPGFQDRVVSAEDVARLTIQAIRENRFLVTTHPGSQDLIQERAADVEGLIALRAAGKAEREGLLKKLVKK
jgi:NAD(P)-dependent dehydrogenase (short-subunit alcohol dehydrogenase family)